MPEASRYLRQTLISAIGDAGQEKFAHARVLIVGVGAIGCAAADLLARAGVGHITLLDRDLVDLSNLQRQCLFSEQDAQAALPKAQAAVARLAAINSLITLQPLICDLSAFNAESTLAEARPTIIVDGTDNFETRYLLNDLSVKYAIPYAYAGVIATAGMQAIFAPPGPCLRCVFPDPAAPGSTPTCDTAGVLGAAVGAVGAFHAAAILHYLITGGSSPNLRQVDVWANTSRTLDLSSAKQPDCPCCAHRVFHFLNTPAAPAAILCGQNAVQISPPRTQHVDLAAIAARLQAQGRTTQTRLFVRCTPASAPTLELTLFPDARAIIRGTTSPETARSWYDRLIGS